MSDSTRVSERVTSELDDFYGQDWLAFILEADKLTGGGPVARQAFIDAREKHLASEL